MVYLADVHYRFLSAFVKFLGSLSRFTATRFGSEVLPASSRNYFATFSIRDCGISVLVLISSHQLVFWDFSSKEA